MGLPCLMSHSRDVQWRPIKRLQHFYQETLQDRTLISKMIEYVSFNFQCTLVALLVASTCHLYSLLKIAEASINDLLPEVSYYTPESDMKQQKLIECALMGSNKQFLGKAYTEERVYELTVKEVNKLFSN